IRAALAMLGSAAIEGPVISWVADHRKHHAFSDRAGDPHSPMSATAMAGGAQRAGWRQRFDTGDESRNLAWLAPLSLGEAWHNNHHAFPTSAAHGLSRRELDPSALVIRALERLGLVWNVVRVSPERQTAKLAAPPAR